MRYGPTEFRCIEHAARVYRSPYYGTIMTHGGTQGNLSLRDGGTVVFDSGIRLATVFVAARALVGDGISTRPGWGLLGVIDGLDRMVGVKVAFCGGFFARVVRRVRLGLHRGIGDVVGDGFVVFGV